MGGWFFELFGFEERSFSETRRRFAMEGEELICKASPYPRMRVGPFSLPSLAQLTESAQAQARLGGGLRFRHLPAAEGIEPLIMSPENRGAVFQAASQFNCLEMVGPGVSPRRGITGYVNDPTQESPPTNHGPKCALACPAGTVYRNYLCNEGKGQGEQQIDTLADVGAVVGNEQERYWRMINGYALPSSQTSMKELGERLAASPELVAQAEGALRVGVHWETQVKPPLTHCVAQVYASAVPVAYSSTRASEWEPFARLVLRAAYKATLAVACVKAKSEPRERVAVYLTSLGGGAFGNPMHWICEAVLGALDAYDDCALDVYLVHYGTRVPEYWNTNVPNRRIDED